MKFIHLHNHSDYSILDGAITVDRLIDKAAEFGMPGVALTDHGNMFGAIEFYQKARKKGIKPIIGQEFYIAPRSRLEKDSRAAGNGKENFHHLLLLAMDLEGYKNLIKLSSIAYTEGFYYKPRIDLEVLRNHSRGVICSSACLGGEIPMLILQGKRREAEAAAGRFAEIFGPERFYLELQDNGIPDQKKVNTELVEISRRLNIPLVATNDCHYLTRAHSFSHEVLLCIQTGKILNDENRMRFPTDQFYFKSPDEMLALFAERPEALHNTYKIYEMTDLELELDQAILPNFTVPEGYTLDSYLRQLVQEGARMRFGDPVPEEVRTRIEYELSVIIGMRFSGYFLIVWDFINYANGRGIPVGPGRGSAAGSMVSYCLGITNLNPLRYNLLFERFLNPDRNEMPDMDIDFCADRREEVIEYVRAKYGDDHVSQIITFNKMKAKAVIKYEARGLNIPFAEANEISKLITEDSLEEALKSSEDFKKIYQGSEKGKMLVDISLSLEGLVRSAGKHAAGVVISKEPLTEYVPLYKDSRDGSISSQYDKITLERTGLVKMDFLGLKNLSIIDKCRTLIEKRHGVRINMDEIPLDDPETFSLLQHANTKGVFQLESPGMQNILRKLGPTSFEDIIAVNALYRPGPLDSGMVDDFIARKRNPEKISYPHPSLEPVLRDTLGVIVYQEQVMLISQIMGGFTLPEADRLRKAMGKKIKEIFEQLKEKFIKGAKQKGISPKLAEKVFALLEKFGGYGFNKSHSAAYALVSYQTAYLKAHYPMEYMASLLSAQPDDQDEVVKYVGDCRANGIAILPPDINTSERDFTVEGDSIRFGLAAIKGVGEKAIESIAETRNADGPFTTLRDFLERIDLMAVNKGIFESLIKSGALDCLHRNRAQLLVSADLLLDEARRMQEEKDSGQGNLFGGGNGAPGGGTVIDLPFVKPWHENEKLLREKESLGVYVSGHPLARYEKEIKSFACTSIGELSPRAGGGEFSIVGIIGSLKVRTSKNGRRFAVGLVEDMEGAIEALFFPEIFARCEALISGDSPVMLKGGVEFEQESAKKIIVTDVKSLREIRRESISSIHIKLNPVGVDDGLLNGIKEIIQRYHGRCPVYFHINGTKGGERIIKAHHTYNSSPSDDLLDELSRVVGAESVHFAMREC